MERCFGDSNRNISGRCVRMSLNIRRNGRSRIQFVWAPASYFTLLGSFLWDAKMPGDRGSRSRWKCRWRRRKSGKESQGKERHEIHVCPCMSCLSSHLVLSKMRMEGGCRSHSYCTSWQSTMLFKLSSEEETWKKVGEERKMKHLTKEEQASKRENGIMSTIVQHVKG
jgi:hypothetical protein